MKEYKDLNSIVLEDAYFDNEKRVKQAYYRLEINNDGNIKEEDKDNKVIRIYKADKEEVYKLYTKIIEFIDDIQGKDLLIDDTQRTVILKYTSDEVRLYSLSYNSKHEHLACIIDDFMNDKAKLISESYK